MSRFSLQSSKWFCVATRTSRVYTREVLRSLHFFFHFPLMMKTEAIPHVSFRWLVMLLSLLLVCKKRKSHLRPYFSKITMLYFLSFYNYFRLKSDFNMWCLSNLLLTIATGEVAEVNLMARTYSTYAKPYITHSVTWTNIIHFNILSYKQLLYVMWVLYWRGF